MISPCFQSFLSNYFIISYFLVVSFALFCLIPRFLSKKLIQFILIFIMLNSQCFHWLKPLLLEVHGLQCEMFLLFSSDPPFLFIFPPWSKSSLIVSLIVFNFNFLCSFKVHRSVCVHVWETCVCWLLLLISVFMALWSEYAIFIIFISFYYFYSSNIIDTVILVYWIV